MTIGRILGVDHGDRRTGLAISDPLGLLARPAGEVRASSGEGMIRRVADVVREHDASLVVVGWSRNMDGSEGPRVRAVEGFVTGLRAAIAPVGVETVDERLTTHEAEARLRRRGRRPAADDAWKAAVNQEAATVLLQAYLDDRRA